MIPTSYHEMFPDAYSTIQNKLCYASAIRNMVNNLVSKKFICIGSLKTGRKTIVEQKINISEVIVDDPKEQLVSIRFGRYKYTRHYKPGTQVSRTYFCGFGGHLHKQVYKHFYGRIPETFHIHHRDGNKLNNSINNLRCLPKDSHESIHSYINTGIRKKRNSWGWYYTEVAR